jgi:hypothetical protein
VSIRHLTHGSTRRRAHRTGLTNDPHLPGGHSTPTIPRDWQSFGLMPSATGFNLRPMASTHGMTSQSRWESPWKNEARSRPSSTRTAQGSEFSSFGFPSRRTQRTACILTSTSLTRPPRWKSGRPRWRQGGTPHQHRRSEGRRTWRRRPGLDRDARSRRQRTLRSVKRRCSPSSVTVFRNVRPHSHYAPRHYSRTQGRAWLTQR